MKTGSMKRFAGVLAALLVLGLAATALAQGFGRGYGYGMMGGNGYAQLTPEKQAAVDRLVAEHEKAMAPLREQLFARNAELRALENQQNPDLKAVNAAASEVGTLRGRMFDEAQAFRDKVAKETGWTMGPGMGYGRGYAMMGGSGMGFGRGNCPAW